MAKSISALEKNSSTENIFAVTNFVLFDTTTLIPGEISIEKPFIFDGVVMLACLKGGARFRLNHREMKIEKGQILTIIPRQIICGLEQSDNFFCEILLFPLDFIADYPSPTDYDFILKLNENPCITVKEEAMQSILDIHTLIVKHHNLTNHPYQEELVKSLIFSLLIMVFSVYETEYKGSFTQTKTRQEELTERFFKLLFEYYKKERSVAFYAAKLCLTPKYLSTVIHQVTGRYILDWINEIVIIAIKTSLRATQQTILQISEEYNFSNPSFFGRYFKQYAGMTPMQYRNSKC